MPAISAIVALLVVLALPLGAEAHGRKPVPSDPVLFEQDNMLAQIRLAVLYRRGEGVPRKRVRAYLWASLAARRESHVRTVAEALRATLAAVMNASRIAEAEQLAGTWTETHGVAE